MNVARLSPWIICLLTSCAIQPMPTTPAEFRKVTDAGRDSTGVYIESFEVRRPYAEVARFLKRKNDECLRKSFKTTHRTATSNSTDLTHFTPYAGIGPTKAEFYAVESYTTLDGAPRGDKIFVYLADLKPVSKKATAVELRYWWGPPRPLVAKAVRAWAEGNDVGCPDLTAG